MNQFDSQHTENSDYDRSPRNKQSMPGINEDLRQVVPRKSDTRVIESRNNVSKYTYDNQDLLSAE